MEFIDQKAILFPENKNRGGFCGAQNEVMIGDGREFWLPQKNWKL